MPSEVWPLPPLPKKTAGVASNLVSGDGDVLKRAFLHDGVVRIEGGDDELRQHIFPSVRQGVDVEDREAGGNSAVFGLL